MNNDYKEECWKRYLENQKYEKYDKEDLVDEIIELQEELKQLKENYDRIYNENCKLREEHNITDISLLDENQQLKKQKDDVVEYIKKYLHEHIIDDLPDEESKFETENGIPIPNAKEILLRMLGEENV